MNISNCSDKTEDVDKFKLSIKPTNVIFKNRSCYVPLIFEVAQIYTIWCGIEMFQFENVTKDRG